MAESIRSNSAEKEAKSASLNLKRVGSPNTLASEKKPSLSLLAQQPSAADSAKTTPAREGSKPGNYSLSISGRHFVLSLTALFLCLLVQIVAFCLILRRFAARMAPAQLSKAVRQQPGEAAPAASPRETSSAGMQEVPPDLGGLYLERPPFDVSAVASLEPDWAECLLTKEAAGALQRQAVFQQLFMQKWS
jgi:hypothetical protein